MKKKICKVCKTEKTVGAFYKCSKGVLGRSAKCADCERPRFNTDRRRATSKAWLDRERSQFSLKYWNARARKINARAALRVVAGVITGGELKSLHDSDPHCHYCKTPLLENMNQVDHVNSLKNGGLNTIDNVVFSCKECNQMKSKLNKEHFLNLIKAIYLSNFGQS